MNLLLDTHAVIWFLNGDKNLSPKARHAIENPTNKNFVSAASIWELTIKLSLRKLKIKGDLADTKNQFIQNGFELLPITFEHVITLYDLQFHHRDPFDRLIIAQAISNELTIITKDQIFYEYNIAALW